MNKYKQHIQRVSGGLYSAIISVEHSRESITLIEPTDKPNPKRKFLTSVYKELSKIKEKLESLDDKLNKEMNTP